MSERDLDLVLNSMERFLMSLSDIVVYYIKSKSKTNSELEKRIEDTQLQLNLIDRQHFHSGMLIFKNDFLLNEVITDIVRHGHVTFYTIDNVKSYCKGLKINKELLKGFVSRLEAFTYSGNVEEFIGFLNQNQAFFEEVEDGYKDHIRKIVEEIRAENSINKGFYNYLVARSQYAEFDEGKANDIRKINILQDMEDGTIDDLSPDHLAFLRNHYVFFGYEKHSWHNRPFFDETKKIINNSGLHGTKSNKKLYVPILKGHIILKDLDIGFQYRQGLKDQFSYAEQLARKLKMAMKKRTNRFKKEKKSQQDQTEPDVNKEEKETKAVQQDMSEQEIRMRAYDVIEKAIDDEAELTDDEKQFVLENEDAISDVVEEVLDEIEKDDLGLIRYPHNLIVDPFDEMFNEKNSPVIRDIIGSIDHALYGDNPSYGTAVKNRLQGLLDQGRLQDLEDIIYTKPEAVLFIQDLEFGDYPEHQFYLEQKGADAIYKDDYTSDVLSETEDLTLKENRERAIQIQQSLQLEIERLTYKKLKEKERQASERRIAELQTKAFAHRSISELPQTFAVVSLYYAVQRGEVREEDIELLAQLSDNDLAVSYFEFKKYKEQDRTVTHEFSIMNE